eukprot:TRINITY_DN2113_c0_g2_i1.p1 TRINITY_DN2113_c0_g2~~TRINITY_DN2113_c0_g2_i1.p1  ORF type:complete len:140 (+),score=28.91 TRINITY_DN2113_c0_g2_i1:65-484(+)
MCIRDSLKTFLMNKDRLSESLNLLSVKYESLGGTAISKLWERCLTLKHLCPSSIYEKYLTYMRPQVNKMNYKKHKLLVESLCSWNPKQVSFWLENIHLEKEFGDPIRCASILEKAIKENSEKKEYIYAQYSVILESSIE